MSEEHMASLVEIVLANRARLDVLDRPTALFMARASRRLAEAIEDQLRHYNEHGITPPDPGEAEKLKRADMAAVRFGDVMGQALARPAGQN